jgi:hypothetical protein
MARRGERDVDKERFWRRVVRRWRGGGLTIRAFCAEHRLTEASFYAWRRTIAERDQEQASRDRRRSRRRRANGPPVFVPVHVTSATAAIEIVLSPGRVVRVPPGFDTATLRQLLAVLEEGPS